MNATPTGEGDSQTGHADAWKAIIDFAKTVITFDATIVAAFVGYIYTQHVEPSARAWCGLALIGVSIILALHAFGKSIQALRSGKPNRQAIGGANYSVGFLIGGLIVILVSSAGTSAALPVDQVLAQIAEELSSLRVEPLPAKPSAFTRTDGVDLVEYRLPDAVLSVRFSESERRLLGYSRTELPAQPALSPVQAPCCCCCPPKKPPFPPPPHNLAPCRQCAVP